MANIIPQAVVNLDNKVLAFSVARNVATDLRGL